MLEADIMKRIGRALFVLPALVAAWMVLGAPDAQAQDVKSWQRAILQKVQKNQDYPRSAIARRLEGAAKIEITIDGQGVITSYEVLESTGHDVLDRQLPRLMDKLDPLPVPPAQLMKGDSFTFKLPLVWRLG
ncbi:hypothetical protein CCR85_03470 [Rhodothalassium salexigens]|nr:hypothetical protein [Rhodothalassium salexigens]MBK5919878.1 hypothetical protein [Rhodothalassium salexigens]